MKNIGLKFSAVILLAIIALVIVLPLKEHNINLPFDTGTYSLGLDLHGGVELDYKIDFDDLKTRGQTYNERDTTEGLKTIVEKRVNTLGTKEPTITSANYGNESHIIVQIPTQTFPGNLTDAQIRAKNAEFIAKAKDEIGKVVRLEFKEMKTIVTDADKAERMTLAKSALAEAAAKNANFESIAKKYAENHENIGYLTGSEIESTKLPPILSFSGFTALTKTGVTQILEGESPGTMSVVDGQLVQAPGEKVFIIANILDTKTVQKEREVAVGSGSTASGSTTSGSSASGSTATGTGSVKKETYNAHVMSYEAIIISQKPSEWMLAKTADGKTLDEQYLLRAGASFSQGFSPQVDLVFNDEGKAIFAELTKRLIGKKIAIFVGGQLVTDPVVKTVIADGHAVITGSATIDEAKKVANDITTGKVPAPIYLTSERAIDAKIGTDALSVIIRSGVIGLIAIMVFLTLYYRVSGILAGIALVIYAVILIAIFKVFGITLTLAGIAGMILSIGLAIDANILIFERTKEALREGADITKATLTGFTKSWSAIWDSHVTSLTSAVVLIVFGTSIIKGFGIALAIGIVLSLFTAMWVSRILILLVGHKFEKHTKAFIGVSSR